MANVIKLIWVCTQQNKLFKKYAFQLQQAYPSA